MISGYFLIISKIREYKDQVPDLVLGWDETSSNYYMHFSYNPLLQRNKTYKAFYMHSPGWKYI